VRLDGRIWQDKDLNHLAGDIQLRDIRTIKFSAESDLVVLLTDDNKTNGKIFHGWSPVYGKYGNFTILNKVQHFLIYVGLNSIQETNSILEQGVSDMSGRMITTFMPLPRRSVLVVMFDKYVCKHGLDNTGEDRSTLPLKVCQILDVLSVGTTDKHYLFIGREKRHRGGIQALYAEIRSIGQNDQEIHFNHVLDLGCPEWNSGTDAACTLGGAGSDGKTFFVARVKGFKGSGFLRQIGRLGIDRT